MRTRWLGTMVLVGFVGMGIVGCASPKSESTDGSSSAVSTGDVRAALATVEQLLVDPAARASSDGQMLGTIGSDLLPVDENEVPTAHLDIVAHRVAADGTPLQFFIRGASTMLFVDATTGAVVQASLDLGEASATDAFAASTRRAMAQTMAGDVFPQGVSVASLHVRSILGSVLERGASALADRLVGLFEGSASEVVTSRTASEGSDAVGVFVRSIAGGGDAKISLRAGIAKEEWAGIAESLQAREFAPLGELGAKSFVVASTAKEALAALASQRKTSISLRIDPSGWFENGDLAPAVKSAIQRVAADAASRGLALRFHYGGLPRVDAAAFENRKLEALVAAFPDAKITAIESSLWASKELASTTPLLPFVDTLVIAPPGDTMTLAGSLGDVAVLNGFDSFFGNVWSPNLRQAYVTPAAEKAYADLTTQLRASVASLEAKSALTTEERTTLDAHRSVLANWIGFVTPLFVHAP